VKSRNPARTLSVVVACGWLVSSVALADGRCAICLRQLEEGEPRFQGIDRVEPVERLVCRHCALIPERCFVCGLPTREGRRTLADGRHYCSRDGTAAVFSALEVKRICLETRAQMDRPLARFMSLPDISVQWVVEDLIQRNEALTAAPSRCHDPRVRYVVHRNPDGSARHTFAILNGLPRPQIASAAAHLYAHAWLMEQVPPDRGIHGATVEGFCELVALRMMRELAHANEARRIRDADETAGQLAALLEAEELYDLYRILEWMRLGVAERLTAGDTDEIRRLREQSPPTARQPIQVVPPAPLKPKAPERLTLLGIVGRADRRLALINNITLAAGESGPVQLGTNIVTVRCLEIRPNAVVLEVEGLPHPVELQLTSSP
jgi:hypothetical protein